MPPFKQCPKCKYSYLFSEPINDCLCCYIIFAGSSRPTELDSENKCGTFKPIGRRKIVDAESKRIRKEQS